MTEGDLREKIAVLRYDELASPVAVKVREQGISAYCKDIGLDMKLLFCHLKPQRISNERKGVNYKVQVWKTKDYTGGCGRRDKNDHRYRGASESDRSLQSVVLCSWYHARMGGNCCRSAHNLCRRTKERTAPRANDEKRDSYAVKFTQLYAAELQLPDIFGHYKRFNIKSGRA